MLISTYYNNKQENKLSSGQGVIPDRRYSPRTLRRRIGETPIPTVTVWKEEDVRYIPGYRAPERHVLSGVSIYLNGGILYHVKASFRPPGQRILCALLPIGLLCTDCRRRDGRTARSPVEQTSEHRANHHFCCHVLRGGRRSHDARNSTVFRAVLLSDRF